MVVRGGHDVALNRDMRRRRNSIVIRGMHHEIGDAVSPGDTIQGGPEKDEWPGEVIGLESELRENSPKD